MKMYTAPYNFRQLFYYYLTITELAAQRGYLLFAGGRAANLNSVAEGNLKHTNHLQGLKALLAGPCLLFWSDVLLKLQISLSNSSVTESGVCVSVCASRDPSVCTCVRFLQYHASWIDEVFMELEETTFTFPYFKMSFKAQNCEMLVQVIGKWPILLAGRLLFWTRHQVG